MMRKVSMVLFAIVFIVMGTIQLENTSILKAFVYPVTGIGDLLRLVSLEGGFLNVLSILIYCSLSAVPIIYMGYLIKIKDIKRFEYIVLPLLSITTFLTLYFCVNPHLLYNSLNEETIQTISMDDMAGTELSLLSGVVYILYSALFMYSMTKIAYSNKHNNLGLISGLIYIIMLMMMFSIFTLSLSETISAVQSTAIEYEKVYLVLSFIFNLCVSILTLYLLEKGRQSLHILHVNGFSKKAIMLLKTLHKASYVLLMSILAAQVIKNLYQLIFLSEIHNFKFTFDVPITTFLVTLVVYFLSRYVTKATKIKEENELII